MSDLVGALLESTIGSILGIHQSQDGDEETWSIALRMMALRRRCDW